MPAFVAVVVAAALTGDAASAASVGFWAQTFFFARVAHAGVYITVIPALRTSTYLVSWVAILMIGVSVIL